MTRIRTTTLLVLVALALSCEVQAKKAAFRPQSALAQTSNGYELRSASPRAHGIKQKITDIQGGADAGKSSLSTAMFNLVKGIVGAGVLSLPAGVAAFGDAKSAVLPAVALIAIMGSFSGYNFSLIGRVCAVTGADSYSNAWEKSVGESSAWIPALFCTSKTFIAILSYSMVLAETFSGIFQAMGLNISRGQTLVGVTVTVLFPLCLMKNLASLAPFSLLGIFGMTLTVAVMGIRYFDGSYALPNGKFLESVAKVPVFGAKGASSVLSANAFILVCMLSTAFMAHFNAPKFYNELEDNTIERYNTLVSVSFGIAILIFSATTALGFATFGSSAAGFILSNYSSKDSLIGLSRIAVAFALIFTYPLVFVGCRDGTLSLLKVPKEKQTNANLNKLTVVLLSLVTVAAIYMEDLSFVMSFGGATLGNSLIYIFPAIMFKAVVKNMGDDASAALKNETHFATFSMILGIFMGVVGSKQSLK